MMKKNISISGQKFLKGVIRTCMKKRGENCNAMQQKFPVGSKKIAMEEFLKIFPLEKETAERIIIFSNELNKQTIGREIVALFFGGDEHIKYALNDIGAKDVQSDFAKLLLPFHLLLPVRVKKEQDETFSGYYLNQGREIVLKNIQFISADDFDLFQPDKVFFVHYGYVVSQGIGNLAQSVLDAQIKNSFFSAILNQEKELVLDCQKILKAFSHMNKK